MSQYSVTPESEESSGVGYGVDPVKYQQLIEDIKSKQSLPMGILGGFIAAVVAAVIWTFVTYATGYQIGFMAVGVGFLVGFAVNFFGKGMDNSFGIAGAALSLFGCLLGNLLMVLLALALSENAPVLGILLTFLSSPGIVIDVMKETFRPIDLLFYGIAVYEGYRFSIRALNEEEEASVRKTPVPATPAAYEPSNPAG